MTATDASTSLDSLEEEWMMSVDEQPYGPYSIEDLQLWLNDESIEPDVLVNNGGEWIAVSDVVKQFSRNSKSYGKNPMQKNKSSTIVPRAGSSTHL